MSIKPLIKLENVSKYYKTKTGVSEGMRNINLEFYNNEFVGITGESGSGKTTLLNVISGLDSYEDGELYYNGFETSHYTVKDFEKFRAENIAFVFQDYNIIESYTVLDNVIIALMAQNYNKKKIKQRAIDLIEKVGLKSHLNHKTSKLSGGQKQRVVIARALAKDAPIILADEPTGNLDTKSSEEILTLLKEISKDKLVILVSHNLEEVKKYATRNVVMENGSIKNDNLIKETTIKEVDLKENEVKDNSINKSFKIAIKNLLSTPKRSIFTLFLSLIVLFSFVYFYSTIYANFINNVLITGNRSEISLIKRDDSPFVPSDLDNLKTNKHSKVYFDFKYDNTKTEVLEDGLLITYYININLALDVYKENINGTYPNNKNEVLINNTKELTDSFNIGDKILIEDEEFLITGIVSDRINFNNFAVYFNEEVFYNKKEDSFELSTFGSKVVIDDYEFKNLVVSSKDRNETIIFKSKINNNKYQAIDTELRFENEMRAILGFLKIFLWIILLLILQVIFLIVYQVLKNIMESRKKDFSVYRSIGINETEVSLMILFEQLLISLIASIILIISFELLSYKYSFFYNITRNLNYKSYFLIVIIFSLFSLRQGQKFNKKIFNLTVIESLKEGN